MTTQSKTRECKRDDGISQGDIFQNIRYNYIDSDDDNSIEIIEFIFPKAIIISQACDVDSMANMEANKTGKPTKFMP